MTKEKKNIKKNEKKRIKTEEIRTAPGHFVRTKWTSDALYLRPKPSHSLIAVSSLARIFSKSLP